MVRIRTMGHGKGLETKGFHTKEHLVRLLTLCAETNLLTMEL